MKGKRTTLEQIRVAVRDYLGGATCTDEELACLWSTHPFYERIVETLNILQEAVTPGRLSGFEEKQVNKVMDELIQSQLPVQRPSFSLNRAWRLLAGRLGETAGCLTSIARRFRIQRRH